MAKKRRRRRKVSIPSAIVRFLIGMLLIALVVLAGYYLLFEADYSRHLINSDGTYASTRAYVLPADGSTLAPETSATATAVPTSPVTEAPTQTPTATPDGTPDPNATATPEPTPAPEETPAPSDTPDPNATEAPLIIISTLEPTATPEPNATPEPSGTPTPTPVPTPEPTATPEPTPEPIGTRIPEASFSSYRTDLKLPKVREGANVGVSRCYASPLNMYQVMQINGWGYIDVDTFNGLTCSTYALITPVGQKDGRVYMCTNRDGASRRIHEPELAQNAYAADFEVTIDTSDFATGEYELNLILQFNNGKKNRTFLCPFETPHRFTIVDGEIITTIPLD